MSDIVDIFDISYEGSGVGKLNGQVVFVPKTLPNEKVAVEVVKKTNSFLLGEVKNVVEASEKREEALCPYFEKCGGCDFQHCAYEEEIKFKIDILKKELKKISYVGEIEFVPSSKRFFYRNKLKFEVVDKKLGYFRAKTHDFFEVEKCPIASEEINNSIPLISEFLTKNNFKNLKSVYIKEICEKVSICFLFDKNAQKCHENIKYISILNNFNVFFAYGSVLENNETKVFNVLGEASLIKRWNDRQFEFDVSAFNQVNDEIEEKLYKFIQELSAGKRVVNAYSGQGFLTYLISQNAKFVYGIEYQKSAHECAEKIKLEEYKMENICGKVEEKLESILMKDRIDLIVLDPAREGCQKEVLKLINESGVKEVTYISCNFSTLVRDLKVLQEKYILQKVIVFDMFPCSANMETVAILRAL